MLEREVPTISGSENKLGFCLCVQATQNMAKNLDALLKGAHRESITFKHSPGLKWRSDNYGGTRDTGGETELCGFKVKAGETHCPCVEPASCVA